MDCKVYLPDGQTALVVNIKTIKAIPRNSEGRATVAVYNDDNTQPVASFYDAVGYELVGRRDS